MDRRYGEHVFGGKGEATDEARASPGELVRYDVR
jgi:hypothetical protein